MPRFIFPVLLGLAIAVPASAQQVPGRDLLEFPIATLAEAAPFAQEAGGGLWNPANVALRAPTRLQISVAALNSPLDQAVSAQYLSAAVAIRSGFTAGLSMTRALVSDILRTESDPHSLGAEIPYGTTIYSAALARRFDGLTIGLAGRYRDGTADGRHGQVFTLDAGAVSEHFLRTPLRLAASTFLMTPKRGARREDASFLAGADLPLLRSDSTRSLRAGYAIQHTEEIGGESYLFATGRYRRVDGRVGLARSTEFGDDTRRLRLGLGLHYARYAVAISREEGGAGLGASYQFLLTSIWH